MSRWWKRGREPQRGRTPVDLETELRAFRPAPRPELVDSIADRIATAHQARPQLHRLSRLSFAAAMTTLVLGTLASFGGLSHAASGTVDAFEAVKTVATEDVGLRIPDRSPAQTQYRDEEDETEVTTVVGTRPGAPGGGGAGAPVTDVAGVTAEQLPLTGLGLVTTALVGLGFAGLGLALRRASRMPDGT